MHICIFVSRNFLRWYHTYIYIHWSKMSKAHKNSTTKNTRRLNPYPPISTKTAMTSPTSPSGNRSAGPWNAADDAQLKKARHQGMNWQPIATQFFPTKSANACRKRHERLMDKAQSTEAWDQSKVEHMARIYCELRETMWTMIASKMNESWKVVEAKVCTLSLRSQLLLTKLISVWKKG